jgi:hypothetical protein
MLLALLMLKPVWGADQVELARRYKLGDKINQKITAEYHYIETNPQMKVEITMNFGFGIGYEVMAVDNQNNTVIKITFHTIAMRMAGPLGTMIDYDSSDPFMAMNQGNLILNSLLGLNYTVKFNSEGELVDVSGLDEAINQVDQKLPNGIQKKSLLSTLRAQMNFKSFAGASGNPDLYPKNPVAVGDTWGGLSEFDYNGIPMASENKYTLKDRRAGIAVIEATSQVRPARGDNQFAGVQTGVLEIDEATGWPLSMQLKQEFSSPSKDGSSVVMQGNLRMQLF